MRIFVALDIDDAIRERISRFVEGVRNFAPDARWMKPESLHITLKFIGEQPDAAVGQIKNVLSAIHATPPTIQFRGYGFFPTAKSARVFWIGMNAGPELAALAAAIDEKTAALGIAKEDRALQPASDFRSRCWGVGRTTSPPERQTQSQLSSACRKNSPPCQRPNLVP